MQPFDDADINTFMGASIAVPTRSIYMGSVEAVGGQASGETDGEPGPDFRMAERLIKGIHILDSMNHEPITVHMNNLGGDEYHGLGIYDSIITAKSAVDIKVYGHAMSMGSVILQAGRRRLMMPNSTVMVHMGWIETLINQRDIKANTKEWERINDLISNIYLNRMREKNPRYSMNRLKDLLSTDRYLSPTEAVEIGLADEVII